MSARHDCGRVAHIELYSHLPRPAAFALSNALGALAAIEAFTDDPDTRSSTTNALAELTHAAEQHEWPVIANAISAARACAGQAAARAAHTTRGTR